MNLRFLLTPVFLFVGIAMPAQNFYDIQATVTKGKFVPVFERIQNALAQGKYPVKITFSNNYHPTYADFNALSLKYRDAYTVADSIYLNNNFEVIKDSSKTLYMQYTLMHVDKKSQVYYLQLKVVFEDSPGQENFPEPTVKNIQVLTGAEIKPFDNKHLAKINSKRLKKRYPPPPPPPVENKLTGQENMVDYLNAERNITHDNTCYYNRNIPFSDRKKKYPFNAALGVQVISFLSQLEQTPVEDGIIREKDVIDNITLTEAQIDSLTNILYNYNSPEQEGGIHLGPYSTQGGSGMKGCYWPRHAILFLDASGKVFGYLEICLQCTQNKLEGIPEANFGEFCHGKYHMLGHFFQSIGITHFTDYPGQLPPLPLQHLQELAKNDTIPNSKCYYNGTLPYSERKRIYPFHKSHSVRLISFNSTLGKAPISNGSLIQSEVIENIALNEVQVDSLTNILYNYNFSPNPNRSISSKRCFYPRHALLFVNQSGKIVEHATICLECMNFKSSFPKERMGDFCEGKYNLLKTFFESVGIKHFEDEKE